MVEFEDMLLRGIMKTALESGERLFNNSNAYIINFYSFSNLSQFRVLLNLLLIYSEQLTPKGGLIIILSKLFVSNFVLLKHDIW